MSNKILKQDKIEADNLLEEASEIMSNCINCGLCKSSCPIFRVLKEENISGRGQAILLRNKTLTKEVFKSSLCLGPELSCPKGVRISEALIKAREAAVLLGQGTKNNEKMIDNLRKYGSPYGKTGEEETSIIYS